MRKERHRRGVERAMRDALRRDRARTKILRTSPFGLIEMTRQRIRPSLRSSVYRHCPACNGTGLVKTAESMALEVIRRLLLASHIAEISRVTVSVANDVASYLNNKKRRELMRIEEQGNMLVLIEGRDHVLPEHVEFSVKMRGDRRCRFRMGSIGKPKVAGRGAD